MTQGTAKPKTKPAAAGRAASSVKQKPATKRPRGRPKGAGPIRVSAGEAIRLANEGESPLAYMLRVMREDDSDLDKLLKAKKIEPVEHARMKSERQKRRDWAAQASAPYVHPKLASVDVKGLDDNNSSKSETATALALLQDDELEQMQQLLQLAEKRQQGRLN